MKTISENTKAKFMEKIEFQGLKRGSVINLVETLISEGFFKKVSVTEVKLVCGSGRSRRQQA